MKKTICLFIVLIYILQLSALNSSAKEIISDFSKLSEPKLSILSNKKDKLKISWNKIRNAEYYLVYRTENKNTGFKFIASTENITFVDKVSELNKTYYYLIRACRKNNGNIIKSNQSNIVEGAVVTLKTPVLKISEYKNSVLKLEWETDQNASLYKVYRKNYNEKFSYIGSSQGNIFYDDNYLKAECNYTYKVIAVKVINEKEYNGTFSNEINILTSKNFKSNKNLVIDNEWAYFLVNKENYLPKEYTFNVTYLNEKMCIDSRCADYARKMFEAAEKEDVYLKIVSSYRSYEKQQTNLNNFITKFMNAGYSSDAAYAAAIWEIAPPGASEHNAGIALDILPENNPVVSQDFDKTEEYIWLKNNSWKYGFIMRYLKGKESVTGYIYEPWHYRFIGLYHAENIAKSGLCLEEYMALQ